MRRVLAAVATVLVLSACRDVVEPGHLASPVFSPSSPFSWTPIASMGTERYGAMAATGADGRVYLFGGVNFNTVATGAEAYSPSNDSWTAIADPGVTFLAGAARGGDGRIYLAGGDNNSGVTSAVQAYDPGSDTYVAVASMAAGREAPVAATGLDGKVYVVGGFDASAGGPTTSGEVYDHTTDTWTPIAPSSVEHYAGAAATGSDGRIYVFGGLDASFAVGASVEAYNPATNTWSSVAPMPEGRYAHAAVAGGDGHIYVFGGTPDDTGFPTVAFAYEPATDTWTTVASLNTPRYLPASAGGLDGRVYAIGGFDGSTTVANSAETLETATPDTEAPTVSLVVSPSSLWPPDHQMVRVASGISATDDRDVTPALVVTVTSNEPDNGLGDGDTDGDTQVVDNGNNTFDVWVRAERSGHGTGRVYTITCTATDAAGNVSTLEATVLVPGSQSPHGTHSPD